MKSHSHKQTPIGPGQFSRDLIALIPVLRASARNICRHRDAGDDLAQETLAKAWRAQGQFETGTNLKAWLFTILRNEFYSQKRRNQRESQWDQTKGERIAAPPSPQLWALQLADAARGLCDLPTGQRDALVLVAVAGFSYEEASNICGVPTGTIRSRIARGRNALIEITDGRRKFQNPSRRAISSNYIPVQLAALTSVGAQGAAYA